MKGMGRGGPRFAVTTHPMKRFIPGIPDMLLIPVMPPIPDMPIQGPNHGPIKILILGPKDPRPTT